MPALTDKQIQQKLNQIVKLADELAEEAERRYGPDANLFAEADGGLHLMDGDDLNGTSADRQTHIKFTADGYCRIGGGGW